MQIKLTVKSMSSLFIPKIVSVAKILNEYKPEKEISEVAIVMPNLSSKAKKWVGLFPRLCKVKLNEKFIRHSVGKGIYVGEAY